jgi:uncharacterized membrane protein
MSLLRQPEVFFYYNEAMEEIGGKPVQKRSRARWAVFAAAGLLLFGWLLYTPPGILGKADAVGYAVCHRIDERSFQIFERAMPLCSRCSGMYLGALVGILFQAVWSGKRSGYPPMKLVPVLALLLGAFAFDGINSFLHLIGIEIGPYEPENWLRLVTGTGMGLVIAVGVVPGFNQTAWADFDDRPALPGWKALAALLGLGLAVILLVLTENPLVLYPLALASSATVVLLLSTIYTMVWLMLLKKENRYQRLSQMALPLALGFMTALLQIAAFNAVRFWLTGTWDGFIIS